MASITYESLIPDIIPYVQGCPDVMIQNAIRSTAIDFCERTGAFQQELDPVTTVSGIYEYDLEPPSGYIVQKIMWVIHKGADLEPITTALLEQRYRKWRDETGTPSVYVKVSQALFHLVPIPDSNQTSSTILRVQLKPTQTSVRCDSEVMNDYRDTIVNGAIFRLLRIPSRDWTDYAAAGVYNTLYLEGVNNAERRARGGDEAIAKRVSYGGIHTGRETGKYASRRIFRSGSY